jgi:hypothetical protein
MIIYKVGFRQFSSRIPTLGGKATYISKSAEAKKYFRLLTTSLQMRKVTEAKHVGKTSAASMRHGCNDVHLPHRIFAFTFLAPSADNGRASEPGLKS